METVSVFRIYATRLYFNFYKCLPFVWLIKLLSRFLNNVVPKQPLGVGWYLFVYGLIKISKIVEKMKVSNFSNYGAWSLEWWNSSQHYQVYPWSI